MTWPGVSSLFFPLSHRFFVLVLRMDWLLAVCLMGCSLPTPVFILFLSWAFLLSFSLFHSVSLRLLLQSITSMYVQTWLVASVRPQLINCLRLGVRDKGRAVPLHLRIPLPPYLSSQTMPPAASIRRAKNRDLSIESFSMMPLGDRFTI